MKRAVLCLLLSLLICLPGLAHPGRTDSQGGHWNHETGEYHFHNGTSSTRSGSSGGSVDHARLNTSNLIKPTPRPSSFYAWFDRNVGIIVSILPLSIVACIIFSFLRIAWESICDSWHNKHKRPISTPSPPVEYTSPYAKIPWPPEAPKPVDPVPPPAPLTAADFRIVFVHPTDRYYHRATCPLLFKMGFFTGDEMPEYKAVRTGHSPCPTCSKFTFPAEEPVVQPDPPPEPAVSVSVMVPTPPPSAPSAPSVDYFYDAVIISCIYAVDRSKDVYLITLYGIKYHRPGCPTLSKNHAQTYEVNLDVALKQGFAPCKVCCMGMPEPEVERISSYYP